MKTKLKKPAASHLEAQPSLSQICNLGKMTQSKVKKRSQYNSRDNQILTKY